MIKNSILVFILIISFTACNEPDENFGLVIHGGAGLIKKENMTPELEKQYETKLTEALAKGYSILKSGGSSRDAVEQTIQIMENSPLFNAGKGAVFTHDGYNELDAAVMDGKTLEAGAVAGVRNVKNPITLARKIMENSAHVMLSGNGALEFAREQGLEIVDSSYFFTERRWKSLQKALKDKKFGTVGCVALDKEGNLFAGTSTGGMTNKQYGRIGDSPIIGAGTYANNNTCAISATGHGEFFIRYTVAHEISALMKFKNYSLDDAAKLVINGTLKKAGGEGGLIGIDCKGKITMPFNTPGMFRGFATSDGERGIFIYKE
ncbi:MAG: isoaspartyl peptidase/L-asparaginase [Bacteroidales bacterium]|nr:isoaspartyl peptidase/L-asparaginase [Bacteroidales bacterium]